MITSRSGSTDMFRSTGDLLVWWPVTLLRDSFGLLRRQVGGGRVAVSVGGSAAARPAGSKWTS
ncbi:hypothetical protein FRAHR75_30016 [Frankia sp. Hr75.2]|nr:hypothetical protein FRAHR75_30016 [Frankia sp. Hr75.2]SQD96367.1 hypothetical protein FMEAI12_3630019 [Parafrankia sp. Ea1.12]